MNILIAEDDPELAHQARQWLHRAGHVTRWSANGREALALAREAWVDVLVLDIGLPEMDGFQIIQHLRSEAIRTPVLCLTARDGVMDRVHGLQLGADDYLTKPFAEPELLARVEALFRRSTNSLGGQAIPAGWRLDPVHRQVQVGDMVADLMPREWLLLELFMANAGRVLTKSFLLEKVWNITYSPGTNVVDVLVCRLRAKLDRPGQPPCIETQRGKGYIFNAHA
jgi:DNA-binding response OmpR family regulator